MSVRFEKGKLPNGETGELCVVEMGPASVGTFPADAMSSDGKHTYREKFAAEYEAFQNGDQPEPVADGPKTQAADPVAGAEVRPGPNPDPQDPRP